MFGAKAQPQEEEVVARGRDSGDDEGEGEGADAESVGPPSEFDKEDMDRNFVCGTSLRRLRCRSLGYMGRRGCQFDMPVRRKVSMRIRG